ncbi:MAG TPA: adenylate/guanylate cyclase domain-containing protein [Chthoniobacterales bacterium]|jgi:adenylate cyclase
MDASLKHSPRPVRYPLMVTALSPLIPHLLGSVFNIWYNMVIIDPLLRAAGLRNRFIATIIIWNVVAYPIALAVWLRLIYSLRSTFHRLLRGEPVPAEELDPVRRRLVNLPWYGAAISSVGWLCCIPVFLISFAQTGQPLGAQLFWHLPLSFAVSGFIAISQGFFLIELASHWGLFPVFFANVRADRLKGIRPISLRTRGLMWAISAGICPIGSLILLNFAPPSPGSNPQWFGLFVGTVGIAFGLCSALLIGRSIVQPVDQLRAAAQEITEGNLDVHVPLRRADEFGALISEFNRMVSGLREKERIRRSFGLHVGRKAAEEILARDPGLGGTEQIITVMFVDIRSFTARSAHLPPDQAVALLNEFLRAMVEVVEGEYGGMINKFLGDGFMALFGVGSAAQSHADKALAAGHSMERKLERLNLERVQRGEDPLGIGIGINTGPAIVGSIGSPDRMEFTVIGNTVNVASRIEALNKVVGTSLLLSKATRDALQRPSGLRALPPQEVKGVDEPVEIFTLEA